MRFWIVTLIAAVVVGFFTLAIDEDWGCLVGIAFLIVVAFCYFAC